MSRTVMLALCLGLWACGDKDSGTPDDTGEPEPEPESAAERAFRYLQGTFENSAQASADGRYYFLRLETCALELPELGARVLYAERVYITEPDDPIVQSLWVVEDGAEVLSSASVAVYTLGEAATAMGNHCRAEEPADLTNLQPTELPGCREELIWDGDTFAGGTSGSTCARPVSSADYETVELVVAEDRVERWDRGYDDTGSQVSGSELGPTIYDRTTDLPPAE